MKCGFGALCLHTVNGWVHRVRAILDNGEGTKVEK